MERNFSKIWCFAILFLFLSLIFTESAFAKKERVAVLPFDDGSLKVWWSWHWSPGTGISDMLVTSLVKSKVFDVIEREQINKILEEQGFSQSGMVDETTAGKVGKILGVDFLITGKVTEFALDTKEIGAGGFKLGKIGGVKISTTTAKCSIDARMVDVNTARITIAVTGTGKKEKKGFKLDSVDWERIDFTSSNFEENILGQATREAVNQVIQKLVGETKVIVEGKVISVSGEEVKINLGKGEVEIGMELKIVRLGEELTDPDTGEILGREEEEIGIIKVSEVQEKWSKAKIISSKKGIERGDVVRK